MNDIYLRIKALLEEAGIAFNNGGITQAEIYAYSKAIEYIKSYTAKTLDEVFITGDSTGEMYAKLLNIDMSRYTTAELKEIVKSRLGMTFGESTVDDLEAAFGEVGSGSYTITENEDGTATIEISDVEAEDWQQLGRFIEEYSCPSLTAECDGTGLRFSEWDRWAPTAYQLNRLNLPFSAIETLRRNMI